MYLRLTKFAAVAAMLVPVSLLQAQTEPPTNTPPPSNRDQRDTTARDTSGIQDPNRVRSTENDAILATWLAVANENEIALARLAQQRAQSAEVKQFAQKMIDDHTQMLTKLQQFGARTTGGVGTVGFGERDTTRPGERGTGGTTRPGERGTGGTAQGGERGTGDTTRPGGTGSGTGGTEPGNQGVFGDRGNRTGQPQDASMRMGGGSLDHVALLQDLGRKCRQSATEMLNEKQGAEFDKAYMHMAVAAHVHSKDTIEVFRNYSSDRLRTGLDEALRTVNTHLEHAKTLCKKTDEAGGMGGERR